ncbi:MAG: DUF5320 domain-containing protein [candidate division WOR-3 bacterium]
MPFGDRIGPLGIGQITGRGAGYCAGYPVPDYMNSLPGSRGSCRAWFGRGGGRGWRHWYWATGLPGWVRARMGYPAFGMWQMPYPYEPSPKEEMAILKEQAEFLEKQLEEVQNRISTLEKAQENE